jgi:IS4 transposase
LTLTDSQKLQAAVEVSPLTVLVQGLLAWAFPPGSLAKLFRQYAPNQRDQKLTISAITWLMLEVVTGARRSVHAAHKADLMSPTPTLGASYQALYQKYGRLEPEYSAAVVRASAQRCVMLLAAATATVPELFGWEGYRVRIIDGTDLDGTEHRLGVLRGLRSAGLPGRCVACYEPALDLVVDVALSEDAYTSERVLVREILDRARKDDLYVCDRFYCTTDILFRLDDREASFVIRYFDRLRWRPVKDRGVRGRVETGLVSEQVIEVEDPETGRRRRMRLLTLELDTPTEAGETTIRLLTNLKRVDARRVCELYRERWRIERHFSVLKAVLNGEVESLGKPRAALFALSMAMVAGNALGVVKRLLSEAHGPDLWDQLSGYYLTDEVSFNYRAVESLVGERGRSRLSELPAGTFWAWCRGVASRVRPWALTKNRPRGPKRPKPRRISGKRRPHYSTHRLLAEREECKC